jgi:hypothetical protein
MMVVETTHGSSVGSEAVLLVISDFTAGTVSWVDDTSRDISKFRNFPAVSNNVQVWDRPEVIRRD